MDRVILAIDLGKFNSVLCWSSPNATPTFRTIRTTPADLRRELLRLPVSLVVFEACSASGWVHDLCDELHLASAVANTNGVSWQWNNVKRKTDRDDALKLAQLAALNQLPTVTVPPPATRQWKSLIGLRKRLMSDRIRGQNRIRALLVSQGLPAPLGAKAWTQLGVEGLEQLAKPLADCGDDELWRGELTVLIERHRFLAEQMSAVESRLDRLAAASETVRKLETVPGVGTRTAEVLAAHLGDPKRFANANQVSAYAGLVPKQYQSGETDRRGRITKRGPKLLRSALVECAWCSLRYNPWAKATWLRLQANGVSKKKAIVALARKLLVRCWGMLKSGQEWRASPSLAAGPLS